MVKAALFFQRLAAGDMQVKGQNAGHFYVVSNSFVTRRIIRDEKIIVIPEMIVMIPINLKLYVFGVIIRKISSPLLLSHPT
jgi:hypothetical protein